MPSKKAITAVSVTGLRRTRPQAAERPLKKFIGQDGGNIDLNDVHAAILDTGILESISIGLTENADGGMTLAVEVREKWALFPILLGFGDTNGTLGGGLAITDANAFGLNDKFVVEGTYGTSGWLASATYLHAPNREGRPGWNVMGSYGSQQKLDTDQHAGALRRYYHDTLAAGLGVQYPATDLLTASAAVSLYHRRIREGADSLLPPENDVHAVKINPALELGRSRWDGYLLSQRRARLDYTFIPTLDAAPAHLVSLRGVYERSVIPGFKAGIRGGIRYSPDAPPVFESPASSALVDILPSTFSAQHYVGAALGLEKYLWKFSQGTLAILASYQAAYSYGPILEHQFDHGPTGAINLYLSRIAIPAIGIGFSYNAAAGEFMVSLNMGANF